MLGSFSNVVLLLLAENFLFLLFSFPMFFTGDSVGRVTQQEKSLRNSIINIKN
jgi:hypothetical protein